MNRHIGKIIALALFLILPVITCRSVDKGQNICEESNRECHHRCQGNSHDFSQSKLATQSVSLCDQRCDKTYQSCLTRQKEKNLPLTNP